MSIFGNIMSAIFGHSSSAAAAAAPAAAAPATPTAQSAAAPVSAAPAAPATAPAAPVDFAAIMDGLAAQSSERLDWRRSIVDLMKLINLDSSLAARKELAQELNYAGDLNDSASMNIWLHKQVMIKLAENGGRVPDELRHSAQLPT
jgi:3-oxoacyl-ACP reductase-like protein